VRKTAVHNLQIRRTVYVGAAVLAGWAFVVSYSHIYDLALAHAQHGVAAKGTPLTVDVLILVASLVLYMQKLEDERPAGLARFLPRFLLWAGIGATVAANMAYGWPSGWLAVAMSAWPGAVFAGVVELVMVSVRPLQGEGAKETVITAAQPVVPSSNVAAARAAYAASVAGGNPVSEYQLHKRYGISRSQARKICAPGGPKDASPAADAPPAPPPGWPSNAAAAVALPAPGASGVPPRPPVLNGSQRREVIAGD
jgi:Protein of unknown function (DUF2637)